MFEKIGIFPIKLVLFPYSVYPLHIFEDRYKKLINECIAKDSEFGINLISSTKISEVGVTARVVEVFDTQKDGSMDIAVEGLQRFRIKNIIDGEKPYLLANVEYFNDNPEIPNFFLLDDCAKLFNEVSQKATGFKFEKLRIDNLFMEYPSYVIAQKAGLNNEQKQFLLESRSENERLQMLKTHLEKVLPNISQTEQIKNLIRNDGYLNPLKFGR